MGYSSFKPKYGHCETCDKYAILISKKCQYCYPKFRAKVCAERNLKRAEKVKTELNLVDNSASELWDWYERQIPKLKDICMECGAKTKMLKREHWAVCHLLPKNIFKSVATNDNNQIELCQVHHTQFDSNIEAASKMKCFGYAVKEFRKFEHLITERHKHLDLFREYAEKHEKTLKKKK